MFALDLKFFCPAGAVELRCARTVKTDRVRVGTASFYLCRKPSNTQILIINKFRKLERLDEKSLLLLLHTTCNKKKLSACKPNDLISEVTVHTNVQDHLSFLF